MNESNRECWWCGKPATRLCDAPIGFEAVGATRTKSGDIESLITGTGAKFWTCDADLCDECATGVGFICGDEADTIDRCPHHANHHNETSKKLGEMIYLAGEIDSMRRKLYAKIKTEISRAQLAAAEIGRGMKDAAKN